IDDDGTDAEGGEVVGGAPRLVGVGITVTDVRHSVASGEPLGQVEGADALAGDGRVGQFLVDHDDVEARLRQRRRGGGRRGGGGGGGVGVVMGVSFWGGCGGHGGRPCAGKKTRGARLCHEKSHAARRGCRADGSYLASASLIVPNAKSRSSFVSRRPVRSRP